MRGAGIVTTEALTDPVKVLGTYWVLRPGDRVLFTITDPDVDEDMIREWTKIVEAKWPDIPCLFVQGGITVAVIGAEGAPTSSALGEQFGLPGLATGLVPIR